jgi:hypothetical protein
MNNKIIVIFIHLKQIGGTIDTFRPAKVLKSIAFLHKKSIGNEMDDFNDSNVVIFFLKQIVDFKDYDRIIRIKHLKTDYNYLKQNSTI